MNLFNIGASGMRGAQLAIATTGQNIANANTAEYKRQYAVVQTINNSIPGRYLPGGVETNVATASDPIQERILSAARGAAAFDTAWQDGIRQVNDAISTPSVEKSFSDFMNATQDLNLNPADPVRQTVWSAAGQAFSTQLKGLSDRFEQVARQITDYRNFQQVALEGLQQAMSAITSGPPTESAKANLVSLRTQAAMLSKTVDGYNKVLNGVLPPINSMFTRAQQAVVSGINQSYGQDIIDDKGGFTFDPDNMGNVKQLTEFGNHKFNREMSTLTVVMGTTLNQINTIHDNSQNELKVALNKMHESTGVDMTEEAVKLLQFQRMYEANAKVMQVSDNLLGTLLSISA